MKITVIIPARYQSVRFPGKIIVDLNGKPLIRHVYESVLKCSLVEEVFVAVDDKKVAKIVKNFGGKVIFTSSDCSSGTERIAQAVKKMDFQSDFVINVQADEPLIRPEMIDGLAECLANEKEIEIVTLKKKIQILDEVNNPNVVKVVTDKNGIALYFSRSVIPYFEANKSFKKPDYYKHLGIYGYSMDFLLNYFSLEKSRLAESESLEQLKFLENGFNIRVIETDFDTFGIDVPEDLDKVKSILNLQDE
jgi:3-deoxy-manno-octulosonate cytidylyltransferase (CMP-KDO synthetase)